MAHKEHSRADHKEKREFFENSLEDVGLILKKEARQSVNFVLIHAPIDVLFQYAEILKMKFPIKQQVRLSEKNIASDLYFVQFQDFSERQTSNFVRSFFKKAFNYFKIELDTQKFPTKKNVLSAVFSKDKDYL